MSYVSVMCGIAVFAFVLALFAFDRFVAWIIDVTGVFSEYEYYWEDGDVLCVDRDFEDIESLDLTA